MTAFLPPVRHRTFEMSLGDLRVKSRVLSFHMYHKLIFLVLAERLVATSDWTCDFWDNMSAHIRLSTEFCAAIWTDNRTLWCSYALFWAFQGRLRVLRHFAGFLGRNCTVWSGGNTSSQERSSLFIVGSLASGIESAASALLFSLGQCTWEIYMTKCPFLTYL
jgi:hypothetical protein